MRSGFDTPSMRIDGPWQTADFTAAFATAGHDLGVAPIPAGPSGAKANPFTGTDGWYINPNIGAKTDLAVAFALEMVSTRWEQIFVNFAGHVPAAPGVTINDPIVQGFADAAVALHNIVFDQWMIGRQAHTVRQFVGVQDSASTCSAAHDLPA